MVDELIPETPTVITAKTEAPTVSKGSGQSQHVTSPVTLNRSRHQPERAEKFMTCPEAPDVTTRMEKLAISMRTTKRRELLDRSRSKLRTTLECTLGAVKPSAELPETREDTTVPEDI